MSIRFFAITITAARKQFRAKCDRIAKIDTNAERHPLLRANVTKNRIKLMCNDQKRKEKKKEYELSKDRWLLLSKFHNFSLFPSISLGCHFTSYIWFFCNNSSIFILWSGTYIHTQIVFLTNSKFNSLIVALERTHSPTTSNRVYRRWPHYEDSSTAFAMSIHCVSRVYMFQLQWKRRKKLTWNQIEFGIRWGVSRVRNEYSKK